MRGSSFKYIINNFNILKYREKILSKKRNLSGKKSKNNLNSFLNFLIKYLVPLTFIFKDNNILYNSRPNLKKYFL